MKMGSFVVRKEYTAPKFCWRFMRASAGPAPAASPLCGRRHRHKTSGEGLACAGALGCAHGNNSDHLRMSLRTTTMSCVQFRLPAFSKAPRHAPPLLGGQATWPAGVFAQCGPRLRTYSSWRMQSEGIGNSCVLSIGSWAQNPARRACGVGNRISACSPYHPQYDPPSTHKPNTCNTASP